MTPLRWFAKSYGLLHGRRRPLVIAGAAAGVMTIWLVGCGITVTPPAFVADPVTVYVLCYSRHTSLGLPVTETAEAAPGSHADWPSAQNPRAKMGPVVEFDYGQWDWYAENRTTALNALALTVLPRAATLGRAEYTPPENLAAWAIQQGAKRVIPLTVERHRATALRNALEARFASAAAMAQANADEAAVSGEPGVTGRGQYNPVTGLWHVHDPADYNLLVHNCNQQLAQWLVELGCRVRGLCVLADVELLSEAAP